MSLNWTLIEPALRKWMMTATGLDDAHVQWADQDAPRPQGTFATINRRLSIVPIGCTDGERQEVATPDDVQFYGLRKLTISCNVYGPGAIALLESAQSALRRYDVRAGLELAFLAVTSRGQVHDLTAQLETSYEERAQLDVAFTVYDRDTETVGYIAEVVMAETYTHPDGTSHVVTQDLPGTDPTTLPH